MEKGVLEWIPTFSSIMDKSIGSTPNAVTGLNGDHLGKTRPRILALFLSVLSICLLLQLASYCCFYS